MESRYHFGPSRAKCRLDAPNGQLSATSLNHFLSDDLSDLVSFRNNTLFEIEIASHSERLRNNPEVIATGCYFCEFQISFHLGLFFHSYYPSIRNSFGITPKGPMGPFPPGPLGSPWVSLGPIGSLGPLWSSLGPLGSKWARTPRRMSFKGPRRANLKLSIRNGCGVSPKGPMPSPQRGVR